jgi:polyphosphate kinase
VTPLAIDPAHPFPFVSNLSLNLLVNVRNVFEKGISENGIADTDGSLARVKIPVGVGIPRFLRVGESNRFVPLEDVVAHNLHLLFPEIEVLACEHFRVTRNANTERDEEEADDLLALIETELRDRRIAPIVRLEVMPGMDPTRGDVRDARSDGARESRCSRASRPTAPSARPSAPAEAAQHLSYHP